MCSFVGDYFSFKCSIHELILDCIGDLISTDHYIF